MERYSRKSIIIFVLLQTILYVSFLILDISKKSISLSNEIKFLIIILCFCFAFFSKRNASKGILFCLKAGLFFTVISDLCILILDYYIYGVMTFIIVQQLYGVRISLNKYNQNSINQNSINQNNNQNNNQNRDYPNNNNHISKKESSDLVLSIIIRFLLQVLLAGAICFLLQSLGVVLETLLVISVFYFICILTNTVRALWAMFHSPPNSGIFLFAIGMFLFLLCDINVGLFNLTGFISLPKDVYNAVYSISSLLMWTFYAPSQVLIALSTQKLDHGA